MSSRVFCGPFEAENYWREPDLATLPSLPDAASSHVVQAMDELLFVLCSNEDRLLSARRMNDAHVEYLSAIGFQFGQNRFDLCPASDSRIQGSSNLFAFIEEQGVREQLVDFLSGSDELEPFAVVPGVAELARQYGLHSTFPVHNVMQRVNTKSYSLETRDALGIKNVGILVESVGALLDEGAKMLAEGPFLVKDDYGVSGKGNQIITQLSQLQRIASYFSMQVSRGKRVRFVLEPYLAKKLDFSCQFQVGKDGSFNLISVQHLLNDGLAFGMSSTPCAEILAKLDREKYFALMEEIGEKLYADGYFGHVCVDSMWLDDGTLAPLIEINARRSMSLIKHAMDEHLSKQGKTGSLTSVAAAHDGNVDFAGLLYILRQSELLFESNRKAGIIPLTCGTLIVESPGFSQRRIRGRLYIEVVYEEVEQRSGLLAALTSVMENAGFHVRV